VQDSPQVESGNIEDGFPHVFLPEVKHMAIMTDMPCFKPE